MRTLCLDIFDGIPHPQLLPMVKAAGFDGFFTDWGFAHDLSQLKQQMDQATALGLICENSHATIPGAELIWSDDPAVETYLQTLFLCLDNCAALNIPILVVHVSPEKNPEFRRGIRRMERVVDYAAQKGVRIAFENTSSEDYLVRTIRHFDGCPTVGFCYDSGHEAFCTPGARFLPQVGDRLFQTHLHDTFPDGDHHLLPFDGSLDFQRICRELREVDYQGSLTLELTYRPYAAIPPERFLSRCYDIACRLANMLD